MEVGSSKPVGGGIVEDAVGHGSGPRMGRRGRLSGGDADTRLPFLGDTVVGGRPTMIVGGEVVQTESFLLARGLSVGL